MTALEPLSEPERTPVGLPTLPIPSPAEEQAAHDLVERYIRGFKSENTRMAMRGSLEVIADVATGGRLAADQFPWWALRQQHTDDIRSALLRSYKHSSVNRHLSALRGILKRAWRLGLIDTDAYHRAIDLDPVRGKSLPPGRDLSDGEILTLVQSCKADPTPLGLRDAALLALLFFGGLRRQELVALPVQDYDAEEGWVTIRAGKGGKDREVPLDRGSRDALAAWLRLRGSAPGPLICPIDRKRKHAEIRPMSSQGVYAVCERRGRHAGVKRFTPHDGRRTCASKLLDRGADLATVQKLLGHASANTTALYDRRDRQAMKRAASLLHFPW